MYPDLVGEYFFISRINNIPESVAKDWVSIFLNEKYKEYFIDFLARILEDWDLQGKLNDIKNWFLDKIQDNPVDKLYSAYLFSTFASIYKSKGNYILAVEYYEKSKDIYEKELPENRTDLASTYNNLGVAYRHKGDFDTAIECYNKALEIRKEVLPENHPDMASTYNNLGNAYRKKGDVDKAIEYVKNLGFDCEYKGEMKGVVPVYTFESDKMNLQVTKNGGMLLMAISDMYIEEAIISEEEAEEKALAFVEKLQIGKVKNVWQEFYGKYAIYNFAPAIEDTVLYPDIFKVKVALDNGDIIAFEGKNYVMNNHKRTLERATVSFKEAEKKLKEGFETKTSRLCLISVNEKEQLCYEFFGKFNDLDFAVYISAIDGEEKTSFRIISTETGKMVA